MIGLILYTALAAKAGLGFFGRQGLIITPEFGERQRIGAILVPLENMPWSDSDEYKWVLDFCDKCNLCVKRCPGDVIYEEVKPSVPGVFTSTDNMKCVPYFSLWLGCSICVKVCPFSRKPYESIKQAFERKEAAQVIEEEGQMTRARPLPASTRPPSFISVSVAHAARSRHHQGMKNAPFGAWHRKVHFRSRHQSGYICSPFGV